VRACASAALRVLTVFAFSSENWNRPPDEVSGLMELLAVRWRARCRNWPMACACISSATAPGCRQGARRPGAGRGCHGAQHAADPQRLFQLRRPLGHRQAAAGWPQRGEPSRSQPGSAMALAHVPDPDLIIRTGGEQRISNFLLWQAAYSELYFTTSCGRNSTSTALDARSPISPSVSAGLARRPTRWRRRLPASRPPEPPMLWQRVITALVLLAILLPALFYPSPVPFAAVVAGVDRRRWPGSGVA
jgi:undecaprenyl diphosphate synthase